MKKFFMGLIVGALLMFSSQIYAATSKLVGNEVDNVMDVTLQDKSIGQAAVIDSTSYLPVRSLADGLNLKVELSDGKIKLSNPSSEENSKKAAEQQATMDKLTVLDSKKGTIESQIESTKRSIASYQKTIANNEKTKAEAESKYNTYSADTTMNESQKKSALNTFKLQIDVANSNIDKLNKKIAEKQAIIDEQEAELAAVNAEIAALEAQK